MAGCLRKGTEGRNTALIASFGRLRWHPVPGGVGFWTSKTTLRLNSCAVPHDYGRTPIWMRSRCICFETHDILDLLRPGHEISVLSLAALARPAATRSSSTRAGLFTRSKWHCALVAHRSSWQRCSYLEAYCGEEKRRLFCDFSFLPR